MAANEEIEGVIGSDEDLTKATNQYEHYRLLSQDEFFAVSIQDILVCDGYYYLRLTADETASIPLCLRIARDFDMPDRDAAFFARIGDDIPPIPKRIIGSNIEINPSFDGGVTTGSEQKVAVRAQGEEYDYDLIIDELEEIESFEDGEIDNSKSVHGFDDEAIETFRREANISDWYYTEKLDDHEAVPATFGEIVGANETDSDNRVSFSIYLGEEETTVTFAVPPDGDQPKLISEFIETCGGHIGSMEGTDLILELDNNSRPLTTDCGLFDIVPASTFESELEEQRQQERQQRKQERKDRYKIILSGIGLFGFAASVIYLLYIAYQWASAQLESAAASATTQAASGGAEAMMELMFSVLELTFPIVPLVIVLKLVQSKIKKQRI